MKNTLLRRFCTPATFATSIIALTLMAASPVRAQAIVTNKSPWVTSAAVGVTMTRGNSDTELFTANIGSERKTSLDDLLLGGDATYGENQGTKNAEILHGFAQYNRIAVGNFYYGLRFDANHDGIADIKYRLTLAPLVGYYFIKETNTTLSAEAGPAVVNQHQGNQYKTYATLRLGERFEHKFSPTARVWQTFEILPQVDYFKNYVVNAEVGVESALTTHASLRLYVDDTYYNVPAAGRLKNDMKLVGALAYKF